MPQRNLAVIATLDTKGAEAAYLRDRIKSRGHRALLIDAGLMSDPATTPGLTSAEVTAAGVAILGDMRHRTDREASGPAMARLNAEVTAERSAARWRGGSRRRAMARCA